MTEDGGAKVEAPMHILGMEPEKVARQMVENYLREHEAALVPGWHCVHLMMEFNKWLVSTNETLQKLVLDKINTQLPQPIIAACAPAPTPAPSESADARNTAERATRAAERLWREFVDDDKRDITRIRAIVHIYLIAERDQAVALASRSVPGTPPAEHLLMNLLAVIHRDGGHYVADHGLEKAAKDAEHEVIKLRSGVPGTVEEERKQLLGRAFEILKALDISGTIRYHDSITDPKNLTLTRTQTRNGHLGDSTEFMVGARF